MVVERPAGYFVELGKQLAGRLLPALKGEADSEGLDQSTRALIAWIQEYGDC